MKSKSQKKVRNNVFGFFDLRNIILRCSLHSRSLILSLRFFFFILICPSFLSAKSFIFERNTYQIRHTDGTQAPEVLYFLRTESADFYFRETGLSIVTHCVDTLMDRVQLKRTDFEFANQKDEIVNKWKALVSKIEPGSILGLSYAQDWLFFLQNDSLFILTDRSNKITKTPDKFRELNLQMLIERFEETQTTSLKDQTARLENLPAIFNNSSAIAWVTYVGGSYADELYGEALCTNGDLITVGRSQSFDFPVDTNAVYASNSGSYDAVILRLKPDGTKRWCTYFGGSDFDDALGVATIGEDIVFVGTTNSINLPMVNATQPSLNGSFDAFVVRMDSAGQIIWSTYYGGSAVEQGLAITVDAIGSIYIGGAGFSTDMPMAANGWQPLPNGLFDAYIVKLSGNGVPIWATFCGGTGGEDVHDITVGSQGWIAIVGETNSLNFPSSANALQPGSAGSTDAYLLLMDTAGNKLYATYLGGFNFEDANGVKVDSSGRIYMTGVTFSPDFPITGNSFQSMTSGNYDVFLACINGNSGLLEWSTFYGGSGEDRAYALDLKGKYLYVGGYTGSTNFPITIPTDQDSSAGLEDGFYFKFDTAGNRVMASYFGGTQYDGIWGLVVNADTMAYLIGNTFSTDLPTNTGVLQPIANTLGDGFVAFRDVSDVLSSVGETENTITVEGSSFYLYPNPAYEEVFIQAKDYQEINTITLLDINGKILHYYQTGTSNLIRFKLTDQAAGIYVLEVKLSDGNRYYQRLIIR